MSNTNIFTSDDIVYISNSKSSILSTLKGILIKFNNQEYIIDPSNMVKIPKEYEIFKTLKEANYSKAIKLILDPESKTKLENYKRSKYYSYYLSRISEEYPELLI